MVDEKKKKKESKPNVAAGEAFIQQREQKTSKLAESGQTIVGARRQASQELAAQAEGRQVPVAEAQAARQQTGQTLQQAGAFEQVTPREVPLAPVTPTGDIAVIGPAAAALAETPGSRIKFENGQFVREAKKTTTGEEAFPVPVTAETVREESLRQISKNSFNKGISDAESFGTLIESVPVVGQVARKWASGLIETPSANADNVIGEVSKIGDAASTGQEKVRNGLESPEFGLDRARKMEEDVANLEGRIKLLINTSPILRANTDEVNKIQEEILRSKERIARYRQASSFGLTAELTGTGRVVPTDEQLFFELQDAQ